MIYISSSNVEGTYIVNRVEQLARAGFRNIELSGGTNYYDGYLEDLLRLKRAYNLEYLIHNYFPPPRKEFVLNLASPDSEIAGKSMELCKRGIEDAAVVGSPFYSLHAGFYFDPEIRELGGTIQKRELYQAGRAQEIFIENVGILKELSSRMGLTLYIENNSFNRDSRQSLNGSIPAMLLHSGDFAELRSRMDFNLLLDLGHLKVSAQTLGLDFRAECSNLISCSDYLHLSENNGFLDENRHISGQSDIYEIISGQDISDKVIVLEVYEPIDKIKESYDLISNLIERKQEVLK